MALRGGAAAGHNRRAEEEHGVTIAVLGGSGFIGAHLVQHLRRAGAAVVALDRHPLPYGLPGGRLLDLRDRVATGDALAGCRAVVDLAAAAHEGLASDDRAYEADSLQRLHSVIAAASAAGVRCVLLQSSVSVYGPAQPGADETARLDPRTPYARSKLAAEAAWSAWQAAAPARRRLVRLRACVVFGEGHRGNVQRLISALARGRFAMVGEGSNRKSIAYVGNLVAAIAFLLDGAPGDLLFNYADTPAPSVAELVARIRALLPGCPPPRRVPTWSALLAARSSDRACRLRGRPAAHVARLRSFLADTRIDARQLHAAGFQPPWEWAEGLQRTIAAAGYR
jgi:GlcNAc-P-P-Und epimerase